MDCREFKCHCERSCYVLNTCLFTHPLAEGSYFHLKDILKGKLTEKAKTARVLQFLHEKQPPKYKFKKKNYPFLHKKNKIPKTIRIGRHSEPNPFHPDNRVIPNGETLPQFLARINKQPQNNFHEDKE